ncbi:MAG TPA: hypothetical protein PLR60_15435 [Syntrophorhabdaceae bacterium]|nr:hypothetical protein [Syntrophorhabdaceae bacterium]
MKIYTKLGDDLDMMIRSFETNPAVSDRQKETWRQEGKKRAITHGMFGYDHEKALAFEDGTKVGSMKQNSARRFWDYAGGHVFPPEEDVARFCLFMHLDIYRTLALLLKARWERFFAHDVNEWRAADGTNLTDILLDADEHALREALVRFQPRGDDLYNLLTELACRHAALPERSGGADIPFLEGHTPSTFAALVDEMLMGRYHFLSMESAELTHFTAQARKEFFLLVEGTREQQRIYPLEKARWVSLRQELEDLYLLIENQRLRNAHTRREWLAVFGGEEIGLREAALDYERSDIRYNLKAANPGWTIEDIERCLGEEEIKRQLELSRLRTDAALAPHLVRQPGDQSTAGKSVEPDRYLKECKTVLRQIHRLLHPDKLMHHPSYKDLTDGQKERLQEMLLSALEVRPEELGYPEGYLLHDMRSLDGLKNALSRIEAILGNPGIDTDERLSIKGETLPEKLKWLQMENRVLEDEILSGKAEMQALFEDDDAVKKRAVLNDPSCHEKVKDDFRARTAQLRLDAERLQGAFDALFEQ